MFIHSSEMLVAERNSQYHTRGIVLCLVVPENERYNTTPQVVGAVVRKVTYKPFGNFAVANIPIGNENYGMWGDLGDGTGPIVVHQDTFDAVMKVPQDVLTAHHNAMNAGHYDEGRAILKRWARENERKLSRPVNRRRTASAER